MPPSAWLKVCGYVAAGTGALFLPIQGLLLSRSPTGRALFGLLLLGLLSLGLLLCWLFIPRLDLPWRRPKTPWRGLLGGGRIAITFDDGPNGADTAAILDVLRRHGARATFFCVGRQAAAQPDLVARMAREGHVIGNHTQDHHKLTFAARTRVARQIDDAQEAIRRCGVPAPAWFRAPHGFKSLFLFPLLRARGLRLCAWTHGVWDTDRPGAEIIVRRALRHLRDGEILLLHDGGGDRSQTAIALDSLLAECRRRRLCPVTLPEIIRRDRPFAPPAPVPGDAGDRASLP